MKKYNVVKLQSVGKNTIEGKELSYKVASMLLNTLAESDYKNKYKMVEVK